MTMSSSQRRRAGPRDLLYFQTPALWGTYPFLPVSRRVEDGSALELGVLYDAVGSSGTYGYRCTVFCTNLFFLPKTEAELLACPRYVYDTFEELADAGWTVD